jgi:hypothetical protein
MTVALEYALDTPAQHAAYAKTLDLLDAARDDGKPQLAEMADALDAEAERLMQTARVLLSIGQDPHPDLFRKVVVYEAAKRLITLIASKERAVAAVLRSS